LEILFCILLYYQEFENKLTTSSIIIEGLENAKYIDPYGGGKGNSIIYLSIAHRKNDMRVMGIKNLFDDSSKEPVLFDEGYDLSNYKTVDGKGVYVRQNGEMIVASCKYNKYIAAFDITHETAFSENKYDELLAQWGDKVEIVPNPENPDGWFFSEGFPIREVIKKNDTVVVDGESYSSYEVYLDYAAYLGYDELPYYLFGTSQAGRDLFSLVWVGLSFHNYCFFVIIQR